MTRIIASRIEPSDYFVEPVRRGEWFVDITAANDVDRELGAGLDSLMRALNDTHAAMVRDAVLRMFGDRYGDDPDVVLVPAWEVGSYSNLWRSASTLDEILREEDESWDAFDVNGNEWTPALDDQCNALADAMIAHHVACTDDECECREAVTR